MPFFKRYGKRKRSYRRRNRRYRRSFKRFAKKVRAAVAKFVERKFITRNGTQANVLNTGTLFAESLIPQGNSQVERVGNHVKCLSYALKYSWDNPNSNPVTSNLRVIFFATRHTTATPSIGDVLLYINNTYTAISPYNIDAYIKYRIFYDKMIGQDYYKLNSLRKVFIKFKYHDIEFYDANYNSWVNGSLWLLVCTDATAPNGIDFKYTSRLTYIDA